MVIGQTLTENNTPISVEPSDLPSIQHNTEQHNDEQQQQQSITEFGHSRNSSNTSQLSKASGYSSIHTHSRQSSSGDSGHIRLVNRKKCTFCKYYLLLFIIQNGNCMHYMFFFYFFLFII